MPTCCSAPRSSISMKGSPATCAEKRVHSPPLSQTGQSSGWLMSSSSMTPRCALSATGEVSWVLTTMPSETVVVQEATGLGWPSTSTRHWRQAPTGSSSGWSQNRGTWMPISSAARMTRVPFGTCTSKPSTVSVTRAARGWPSAPLLAVTVIAAPAGSRAERAKSWGSSSRTRSRRHGEEGRRRGVERAAALAEVVDVLVAEVLQRGGDRAGRTVTEGAERPAEDVVADVQQLLEVLLGALAVLQPAQDLHQPEGALPAGRALAARLVRVELGPSQHRAHDAGRLVEDLQRLGPQHRPGARDALVGQGHVEVLGGEDRRGRAAGGPELQLVSLADTAGEVEQLAQGDAHRRLVLPRPGDVTGQRVEREALRAQLRVVVVGALRGEPVDAVAQDRRDRRDRLDVVDDRRGGVEAGHRREGRAQTGLAAASLERVEEGGLLTADVRPGAGVDGQLQVVARPEDVLAEVAGGVRLRDRSLQPSQHVDDLATHVDERVGRADRVGRDDGPLHELVGVGHHQRDVLAGARLRFVGVDDEVDRLVAALGDEAPLHAGREAGAPTPAQLGVLDELGDLVGRLLQRLLEPGVAVMTLVDLAGPRPVLVPGAGQDGSELQRHASPSFSVAGGVGLASSDSAVETESLSLGPPCAP